jgi:hypothetical protein
MLWEGLRPSEANPLICEDPGKGSDQQAGAGYRSHRREGVTAGKPDQRGDNGPEQPGKPRQRSAGRGSAEKIGPAK